MSFADIIIGKRRISGPNDIFCCAGFPVFPILPGIIGLTLSCPQLNQRIGWPRVVQEPWGRIMPNHTSGFVFPVDNDHRHSHGSAGRTLKDTIWIGFCNKASAHLHHHYSRTRICIAEPLLAHKGVTLDQSVGYQFPWADRTGNAIKVAYPPAQLGFSLWIEYNVIQPLGHSMIRPISFWETNIW